MDRREQCREASVLADDVVPKGEDVHALAAHLANTLPVFMAPNFAISHARLRPDPPAEQAGLASEQHAASNRCTYRGGGSAACPGSEAQISVVAVPFEVLLLRESA